MNVTILSVNGSNIPLLDEPEGLSEASLVYERDEFSGMIIKIDVDLIFRCGSGKEAIDEEYNNRFVDGVGYIILNDTCNGNDIQFEFLLDFSKYKYNSSTTIVSLKELNSLHDWKDNLDNEIEIPAGNYEVAYIRNIPIDYSYYSSSWLSAERIQTGNIIDVNLPTTGLARADHVISIFPKSQTTINELELGYELTAETILHSYWDNCSLKQLEYYEPNSTYNLTPTAAKMVSSDIEPQPIFENELEDGTIFIETTGGTNLTIDFNGSVRNFKGNQYIWRECIAIGTSYEKSTKGVYNIFVDAASNLNGLPITQINITNPTYPTKSFSNTYEIKKGESVWIWYECLQGGYITSAGDYIFEINEYSMTINRALTMKYTATQNVTTADLTTNQDLIDWSTEIRCFGGGTILNELCPMATDSIFSTPCYSELYFANGEYMRNKINKKVWKIKPRFFLEEIDKVVGCGVGVFYDISGTPTLQHRVIEDFYSSLLGLIVDDEFDDVKIDIDEQRLYNKLEIGYSNFKDTLEETCGKNSYLIPEQKKGKSVWNRVSEFIASKYLVKKSLRLATDDKQLEFDSNIFLLSLRNIDTFFLHSASQSSNDTALGYDDITESSSAQDFGMNRKFSSIFNLIRNKMRWSFGLYNSKDIMENTSLSSKEITDLGTLNDCGTIGTFLANKTTAYADVDGSYSRIPIFIYFAKAMTLFEMLEFRKKWYETVLVEKDGVNYYGNVLKVEYKKGVARFKLTGKNQ